MADAGADAWISSLRDIHASHFPRRESGSGKRTRDICGRMSPGSSASASQTSSSSKTSQTIYVWGSERSTKSWNRWVSALRRDSLLRRKSARATNVFASSSWPTAREADSRGTPYTRDKGQKGAERLGLTGAAQQWPTPQTDSFRSRGGDRKDEAGLDRMARTWPTPRAADSDKQSRGKQAADSLDFVTRQWRTPQASDGARGAAAEWTPDKKAGEHSLSRQVATWPTPTSGDADKGATGYRPGQPSLRMASLTWPTPKSKTGGANSNRSARPNCGGPDLQEAAETWPTPTERDWRAPNSEASQERRNAGSARGQQLPNFLEHGGFLSRHPDPPTPSGPTSSPNSRTSRLRLNALFVEWLMGWPIGWTDCGSPVTGFSHWLRHSRTALSTLPCGGPVIEPNGQLLLFGGLE
jgi:hypothetical protein